MSIVTLSDEELMINLQTRHNRASFDQLVERFKKPLFSYLYRYLNRADIAEDILQEVFIRLWTKNAQWSEKKGSVKNWLFQIGINLCRDYWRKMKHEVSLSVPVETIISHDDQAALSDAVLAKKQMAKKVIETLKNLDAEQREILILSYYHEFSQKEIADVLQITIKAVERRLARIRETLKHILKDQGIKTAQDGGF